jgi:hypothetical protein
MTAPLNQMTGGHVRPSFRLALAELAGTTVELRSTVAASASEAAVAARFAGAYHIPDTNLHRQ